MGKIIRNGIEYSGTYDDATSVNYDNTLSGLNARTVQEGIDELNKGNLGAFPADNLLSTSTDIPLSANQGRVLDGKISTINGSLMWKNACTKQLTFSAVNTYTEIIKVPTTAKEIYVNVDGYAGTMIMLGRVGTITKTAILNIDTLDNLLKYSVVFRIMTSSVDGSVKICCIGCGSGVPQYKTGTFTIDYR